MSVSALGTRATQGVALEQAGLGEAVADGLGEQAGEEHGAHEPHDEEQHEHRDGDEAVAGADEAPDEADDGAEGTREQHVLGLEALVVAEGEGELGAGTLDEAGHDDHRAIHVAEKDLDEGGDNLRDEGNARTLDDVGRERGHHEPDAEHDLVAHGADAHRGEGGDHCRGGVDRHEVDDAEDDAEHRHEDDLLELPAALGGTVLVSHSLFLLSSPEKGTVPFSGSCG